MQTRLIWRKAQLCICIVAMAITACKKQSSENNVKTNEAAVTPVGNVIGPAKQQQIKHWPDGPEGTIEVNFEGSISL